MLKQFSWPYQLLMLLLLLAVYGFMRQPAVLLGDLKTTLANKDEMQWQVLTSDAQIQTFSKALMQGLLKMKYAADWESGDRKGAMDNYYAGQEKLDVLSHKFAGTEGFRHFICGDLTGFLEQPEKSAEGCWQLDGELLWVSPTQVRVYFANPVTGWQSSLLLQRDSLFSWKVAAVELPVEEILAAYQQRLIME